MSAPSQQRRAVVVLAGTLPWLSSVSQAQVLKKGPALAEDDPQAKALGYVRDARRVDVAHFPKYRAGQRCAACQLYQGAPTLPEAPCTVFAGKIVAGPGWCTAFAPR